MLPTIFETYTSSTFYEALLKLNKKYAGLSVGGTQNKHGLFDELESSLEIFLIKDNAKATAIQSIPSIKAKVEECLIHIMDLSAFSYLSVMADNNSWNPLQCNFEQFRLQNIDANKLIVEKQNTKQYSVKDVFISIQKGKC